MKIVLVIALIFISNNIFAQTIIDSTNIYTFHVNGIKYEIIKEGYGWADAAKIADERGGILAEINSQVEQDTIFYYLNNAEIDITKTVAPDGGGASYIWIGGNDIQEEGIWVWDGNNDGVKKQFWEGLQAGNQIGGLYNNWGNEPDNFSNQDALGLALTNWARGKAGEWNDVQDYNKLYFIIEYDNSTFRPNSFNYLHELNLIEIEVDFPYSQDSVQMVVNDYVNETFYNVVAGNYKLTSHYKSFETRYTEIYLKAFKDTSTSFSNLFTEITYSFNSPIKSYSTDFEDIPENDFLYKEFMIIRAGGFRNKALHSLHNYENNSENIIIFKKPIIVDPVKSQIVYSDVAIVEPGDSGSSFGDDVFRDYVIVEGSNVEGEWLPLLSGYDARAFPDWEMAWQTPTFYRKLFKQHSIELTDVFNSGDTVLIRFRMYSDEETTGWGWVIDSLQIQEFPLTDIKDDYTITIFSLNQNYPNPFNPSTTIKYSIPRSTEDYSVQQTTLKVFDILGREVATLVNREQTPGNYEIQFEAQDLSSGVYFYHLQSGSFKESKKMILLR